jgi:hypothetical protein
MPYHIISADPGIMFHDLCFYLITETGSGIATAYVLNRKTRRQYSMWHVPLMNETHRSYLKRPNKNEYLSVFLNEFCARQ